MPKIQKYLIGKKSFGKGLNWKGFGQKDMIRKDWINKDWNKKDVIKKVNTILERIGLETILCQKKFGSTFLARATVGTSLYVSLR